MLVTSMNQAEALRQYLLEDENGVQSLVIPEGRYKGWVPRSLYDMPCTSVCLPFLKLLSFPVGGSSLGRLVEMERFIAVGNYLSRLPDSFGRCDRMTRLNLSYNHFERVPAAIFQLTNLIELDMSENDLVEISPAIGNLKQLRILNLSGNLLDTLPDELADCDNIERLELARKWYPKGGFEVLPEAVCHMTELVYLDVSWHQISTITEEVRNMLKLQTLKMRGNYLKHVSGDINNCQKLKYLDLTGAMKLNSIIPEEIFTLPDLLVLDLTNNYFTEISTKVVQLQNLQQLIIRRNALLRVPDEIFEMLSLENLDLSENYLTSIPSSVQNLATLKRLYLGCNKIQELPPEICKCESLVELQLHYNELEHLPDEIYKLSNLEELMVEGNKLRTLPPLMDKLEKLLESERVSLHNNSLVRPPQVVCDQGVRAVYAYLKELRICEATHRKKLILIGASKAGKTSLRNVLLLGRSKLTAEHERTWVMEQHLWEPEPNLRVQILDFGGHHIYSAAHHMFLTPEALHVLVFDMNKYRNEMYDQLVGDWLEAIMDRAPGANIMIVGTHSDLCTEEHIEESCINILSQMHSAEEAKLKDLENTLKIEENRLVQALKESGQKFPDLYTQRLQERVNKLKKVHITRVKLPQKIFVVSCAETLSGIIDFHEDLITMLKSAEEHALPTSWFSFLTAIQERPEKILTWSETLELFEKVMTNIQQSMYGLQGSLEKSLEAVLIYLHVTGEIVWYHENPRLRGIVFHHPETLVEMLRGIFRHDFKDVVTYSDIYGSDLTEARFNTYKEEFNQRGLMTVELLGYILQHFQLSLESQDIFIDLMLKFDLCYEVKESASAPGTLGSKRILQFPWFLTSSLPDDFSSKWSERIPQNEVELRFQLQFLKKGLPNFFEKVSARLQSYVTQREDWKDGIFAKRNTTKLLLTRMKSNGIISITLSVRGSDLQELWFLILHVRADMQVLLQEWPFIKFDPYMVCTHCLITDQSEPYLWTGSILDTKCPPGIYQVTCPKTECPMPACLAYPIDPEFPGDVLDKHFIAVTDFLQGIGDEVDSAGVLSDLILSRIAAKLGVEWHTVAIELGLQQKTIEQIQMNNPGNILMSIKQALIQWRSECEEDNEEKVSILLKAIENANRQDLADELRSQYLGAGDS